MPTPEADEVPKPCPFDCGAKITPDDFGLVKHERAAGQRACPLNNAVTDLRTWNRRVELSRSPEAPPTPEKNWLVWSYEHDAWWGPNSNGYRNSLLRAGMYTEAEAKKIADDANAYPNKRHMSKREAEED